VSDSPVTDSPATESPTNAQVGAGPGAIPELTDLGLRLRRAREGRGIGVSELAERLHLAPEQLTALEGGDRSHLHEPVFVIAQAKRVAQALGVDISEQVDSLRRSRLMSASAPDATPGNAFAPSSTASAGAAASGATTARPTPARTGPNAARWALAAAVAALTLVLGLLFAQAVRHWGQPRAAASANRLSSATPNTTGAGPGVLVLRSDEPSWVEVQTQEGQVLFSGSLEKEARFRLGMGLRVLAGRPDLVTAAVGSEAPRRLGTISEVGWQNFAPPPSATPQPTSEAAPAP
jgi:cytoskeleton protein RodZ